MAYLQSRPQTAAYEVLTSEELFRQIVQWSAGWPGLLVRKARQRGTGSSDKRTRSQDKPKRQLHLVNVAIDVSRVRDPRTLRIVTEARWYKNGALCQFKFTGIDDLIRRGDGEALRLVLRALAACGALPASEAFYVKYYYWSVAIAHYAGSCDVLEALCATASPSLLASIAKADFMYEIQHAQVARWFVDSFGASVLPKTLVQVAAERGRRALFYYLLGVPGQDVVLGGIVMSTERRRVLDLLMQCRANAASGRASEVLALATQLGDVELIKLILPDVTPHCESAALDEARLLVDTKMCNNVAWMMPEEDAWDDPMDALTFEAPHEYSEPAPTTPTSNEPAAASTAPPAFSFGSSTRSEPAPTAPTAPATPPSTNSPKTAAKATSTPLPSTTKRTAPRDRTLADGVEGNAEFPSRADASYRFEIVAKDEKLYIWLEDRKTKKQWRTALLAVSDFVQNDLVIPMAKFEDYAKCFLNCLETSSTTESDFSRDLLAATDAPDAWELLLTLKLRVFTTTWTPTYSFLLKPVPLEPVDILAAKIRDQEEQIADLQEQVDNLKRKRDDSATVAEPPLVLRGTLTSQHTAGRLVWKVDPLRVAKSITVQPTGVIRFAVDGTFVVNIMVQNTNSNNSTALELQVNGKSVVSCVDSNPSGHHHVSSIYHVVTVAPEDEISVNYRGNNSAYAGSYIVIHELR